MWQRTRNRDHKILLNRLNNSIRSDIFNYRNKKWEKQLIRLNPNDNSSWRMTKILKNEYCPIPTLQENNEVAFTPSDKAQMLATQFKNVYNIDLKNLTYEQKQVADTVNDFLNRT